MDEVDRKTLNSFVLEAVEENLEHTHTHGMIFPSAQRVSPSRSGHLDGILTVKATAWCTTTKTICAVPAPRRLRAAFFAYFLLLLTKSKSPKA